MKKIIVNQNRKNEIKSDLEFAKIYLLESLEIDIETNVIELENKLRDCYQRIGYALNSLLKSYPDEE